MSRSQKPSRQVAVRGGIWRICAVIDYGTKYSLAATVTPTSRGADALTCLLRAVDEAKRVLDLDDLRADRGEMDVVDAEHFVIGQVPAPVAVVTDNGPCFRGGTFGEAFTGDDPLLRHVRKPAPIRCRALSAWSRTWSGPRRRETSGSPPGSGSPSCPGP